MKLADIVTDTVVYAAADGGGDDRYRAVVLDTAQWRARTKTGSRYDYEIVGYTPVLVKTGSYSERAGILVVQHGGRWWSNPDEISDAELIDLAASAAVTIREGGVPSLPHGTCVRIMRPQDITETWESYVTRQEQEKARRAERRIEKARAAEQERLAEGRLRRVLGEHAPRFAPAGTTWVQMEQMCQAFHAAKLTALTRNA